MNYYHYRQAIYLRNPLYQPQHPQLNQQPQNTVTFYIYLAINRNLEKGYRAK